MFIVGKSFFNQTLSKFNIQTIVPLFVIHISSKISQMTIMHAYQTCIKRIVRFANSLQVRFSRNIHIFTRYCTISDQKQIFIIQYDDFHYSLKICCTYQFKFNSCFQDFVELPPDDMQKLLVSNTVSIINIRIARWFHPKTDLKTQE